LCFLLTNRAFGVWIFFFSIIVLHENRKRMRIHENLFTVGKRTSPHVYSTSTCLLYFHMSTLLPHVYSTSTCLLYFHMSTLLPHVYSTSHIYSPSTCLLYLRMSTLPAYVYSTCTYPLYIHMSTSSLYVYPSFTYLI